MSLTVTGEPHSAAEDTAAPDPLEPPALLFRDLRGSPDGLPAAVRAAGRRQLSRFDFIVWGRRRDPPLPGPALLGPAPGAPGGLLHPHH